MVKKMSTAMVVELTESEDAKHRYVLHKVWDDKKPCCTIITLYPGIAELVAMDTTQMLITNHLYNKGYGGYYSVNLFSKIGISNRKRQQLLNATDKENDKAILGCAEKSDKIIFAWGSLPNTNNIAKVRVDLLLSKLAPYKEKCYYLSDVEGGKYYHPIATSVRYGWDFVKA